MNSNVLLAACGFGDAPYEVVELRFVRHDIIISRFQGMRCREMLLFI